MWNYDRYLGQAYDQPVRNSLSTFGFMTDNSIRLSQKHRWLLNVRYYVSSSTITADTKFLPSNQLDITLYKGIKNLMCSLWVYDVFNANKSRAQGNTDSYLSYIYHNYGSRQFGISLSYSFGNSKIKKNNMRNTSNEDIQNRL